MNFEPDQLYHIFNQGNNRQQIFFSRENYVFFLNKIEKYILPFSDILAWCLMPNHFHIMVQYNGRYKDIIGKEVPGRQTLNESIGILLRSYTRAINRQEVRSGALFREETKAICLTCSNGVAPAWFTKMGITRINYMIPENQYPNVCYNYIINNPVKDGLVKRAEEWEFSSYIDATRNKECRLINKIRIKELNLGL